LTIENDSQDPTNRLAAELQVEELESVTGRNSRHGRAQPVFNAGKHLT